MDLRWPLRWRERDRLRLIIDETVDMGEDRRREEMDRQARADREADLHPEDPDVRSNRLAVLVHLFILLMRSHLTAPPRRRGRSVSSESKSRSRSPPRRRQRSASRSVSPPPRRGSNARPGANRRPSPVYGNRRSPPPRR